MNIEVIRGLVRPLVTVSFIGGFIAMVLMGMEVPDAYSTMTGMVMIFWFKARDETRKP